MRQEKIVYFAVRLRGELGFDNKPEKFNELIEFLKPDDLNNCQDNSQGSFLNIETAGLETRLTDKEYEKLSSSEHENPIYREDRCLIPCVDQPASVGSVNKSVNCFPLYYNFQSALKSVWEQPCENAKTCWVIFQCLHDEKTPIHYRGGAVLFLPIQRIMQIKCLVAGFVESKPSNHQNGCKLFPTPRAKFLNEQYDWVEINPQVCEYAKSLSNTTYDESGDEQKAFSIF